MPKTRRTWAIFAWISISDRIIANGSLSVRFRLIHPLRLVRSPATVRTIKILFFAVLSMTASFAQMWFAFITSSLRTRQHNRNDIFNWYTSPGWRMCVLRVHRVQWIFNKCPIFRPRFINALIIIMVFLFNLWMSQCRTIIDSSTRRTLAHRS